jgi:F0F1-type ATP synthase membrane subunit c/vacuolar-type H+-ATPase subunit K
MHRESGSALVEALIGSAIVAMALGTMFHSVVDSAARNRMAEEKRFATLIAQSELATVGPIVPVAPGVTTGLSLGFPWRIQIEPMANPLPPSNAGTVWRVTVSVRNPKGRQLASISTLALGQGS